MYDYLNAPNRIMLAQMVHVVTSNATSHAGQFVSLGREHIVLDVESYNVTRRTIFNLSHLVSVQIGAPQV